MQNTGKSIFGLFGLLSGATIENLAVTDCDIYVYNVTGVIAGRMDDNSLIQNCWTSGRVRANGSTAGGISGTCDTGSAIKNCYSLCDVSSEASNAVGAAGGIAASIKDGKVESSVFLSDFSFIFNVR